MRCCLRCSAYQKPIGGCDAPWKYLEYERGALALGSPDASYYVGEVVDYWRYDSIAFLRCGGKYV
jgi:hypothetical protein